MTCRARSCGSSNSQPATRASLPLTLITRSQTMRVGVAFLLASVALAAQVPFFQNLDNFPAPEQDLRALSSEQFTTFSHPAFPKHSVRIKRLKDLCDNKSKYVSLHSRDAHLVLMSAFLCRSYSGYIDVEARHLFFYFFESRSSPDEDPVVMWINGACLLTRRGGLNLIVSQVGRVARGGSRHCFCVISQVGELG